MRYAAAKLSGIGLGRRKIGEASGDGSRETWWGAAWMWRSRRFGII